MCIYIIIASPRHLDSWLASSCILPRKPRMTSKPLAASKSLHPDHPSQVCIRPAVWFCQVQDLPSKDRFPESQASRMHSRVTSGCLKTGFEPKVSRVCGALCYQKSMYSTLKCLAGKVSRPLGMQNYRWTNNTKSGMSPSVDLVVPGLAPSWCGVEPRQLLKNMVRVKYTIPTELSVASKTHLRSSKPYRSLLKSYSTPWFSIMYLASLQIYAGSASLLWSLPPEFKPPQPQSLQLRSNSRSEASACDIPKNLTNCLENLTTALACCTHHAGQKIVQFFICSPLMNNSRKRSFLIKGAMASHSLAHLKRCHLIEVFH